MENSEKRTHLSREDSKSSEKRSSRKWKSLASTITASERMKNAAGRSKQESQREDGGKRRSLKEEG